MRFCQIQLRSPCRLENQEPFQLYAVYAEEISPPLAEEAVSWMLLTSEQVTTSADANTILRCTHTDGTLKNITKFSSLVLMLKVIDLLLLVWKQCLVS